MKDLIEQYKETRRQCRKLWEKAETENDRALLSSMIQDCDFVIQWMKTGRNPDQYRGIEHPHAYHKEIPVDPQQFPFDQYANYDPFWWEEKETEPEDEETIDLFIEEMLSCLSEREREVFEMRQVALMEFEDIGQTLGITKQAAYVYYKRALEKIGADAEIVNEVV
jgi:positive control factor